MASSSSVSKIMRAAALQRIARLLAALLILTLAACRDGDPLALDEIVTAIAIDPPSYSLRTGSSSQFTALAAVAGGKVYSHLQFTWNSDNERVARVSPSGRVTAVSPGTARITASRGRVRGTAVLTVPAHLDGWGSNELPLTLHRLNAGSGTVRVSTGIMLVPGQLRETDVGLVVVSVGGIEVPAHVEPLHGRHRDGSVISLLVQFDADPSSQRTAGLRFGAAPSKPRLAKQPIDFRPGADIRTNVERRGYPAAVAVPPVEHMVAAFQLFGPTVSVADTRAAGAVFTAFEDDFALWSDRKFDDLQGQLNAGNPHDRIIGVNYYDRGYHHFAWYARSGDPEYLRRGGVYTFNNRFHYFERHNYAISEFRWILDGLAAHYWLTGDEESRNGVNQFARRAYGNNGDSWNWTRMRPCNYKGEGRPVARALTAMAWASRLGWSDADWGDAARSYADLIINSEQWAREPDHRHGAWVYTHPDFPTGAGCSVEYVANFMNAMMLDALITVYDHVYPDPRIPGVVQRTLDYLRGSQWRGREGNGLQIEGGEGSPSFNYYDVELRGSGGPSRAVDLNGFYVHIFGWYGHHFGGAEYTHIANEAFATLSRNPKDGRSAPWLTGDKQFNETYQKAWQHVGYFR
jgi:hypothetical protein